MECEALTGYSFYRQSMLASIESLSYFSFRKLGKAFLAGNFLKLCHWFPKVLRGFQQNNPVGFETKQTQSGSESIIFSDSVNKQMLACHISIFVTTI